MSESASTYQQTTTTAQTIIAPGLLCSMSHGTLHNCMETVYNKIAQELQAAYKAQGEGKDGLARVCARRAAGWAIQEKLKSDGETPNILSAYEYIKYMDGIEGKSSHISKVISYLRERVVKDSSGEDSYWPYPEVDLVKESHWLVEELLGFNINIEDTNANR